MICGSLGSYVLEMQTRNEYALVSHAELRLSERKCTAVISSDVVTTDTDEMRITAMLGVTPAIHITKKCT